MEARKILVNSTKTQKTTVIMSAATTLSELKSDLRANGIDYAGMTFYEGTSRTELLSDESILPHDIPYKGRITNELAFMLTNSNKKIKSGSYSRSELLSKIKELNLQDECVKAFGKNFTVCKSTQLLELIEGVGSTTVARATKEVKVDPVPVKEEVVVTTKVEAVEECSVSNNKDAKENALMIEFSVEISKLKNTISALLEIIYDNTDILSIQEKEMLDDMLEYPSVETITDPSTEIESPYDSKELEDMFKDVYNN